MKRKILVLAGPSGVGKSTLSRYLLEKYSCFEFSVSATSRLSREGELHGREYYFLSVEEFKESIKEEKFLEWEEVYEGRFYGTLKSEIERINNLGNIAIFDIDVLGALNIKKLFGDEACIAFIKPENPEILEARLRSRGTDDDAEIQMRMKRFEKELLCQADFDLCIINATGKLDESYKQVDALVEKYFLK